MYKTLVLALGVGWCFDNQLGTGHPVEETATDGAPDPLSTA